MTTSNRPEGVEGATLHGGALRKLTFGNAQNFAGPGQRQSNPQTRRQQQGFAAWGTEAKRAHVRQALGVPATRTAEKAQQRNLARVYAQAAFNARTEAAAFERKAASALQAEERAELLATAATFARMAEGFCMEGGQ